MAAASVLGIAPSETVRIEYDDSYQDWPFELVDVQGDRIAIAVIVAHRSDPEFTGDLSWEVQERGVLFYPYEHAQRLEDGSWRFLGGEHPEFIIRPGPPQPPSSDTAGPYG